jgi:hypothetical protein
LILATEKSVIFLRHLAQTRTTCGNSQFQFEALIDSRDFADHGRDRLPIESVLLSTDVGWAGNSPKIYQIFINF